MEIIKIKIIIIIIIIPPSLFLLITYPRIGECFPAEAEK
jgi:hypothetical protein